MGVQKIVDSGFLEIWTHYYEARSFIFIFASYLKRQGFEHRKNEIVGIQI